MCRFIEEVAHYTFSPLGLVLKMGLIPQKELMKISPGTQVTLDVAHPLPFVLTPAQKQAFQAIQLAFRQKPKFCPLLFQGVTGSGKTEVYLKVIHEHLLREEKALILVPEIALTPQWVDRFEKTFGLKPTLWHSQLTPKQRRQAWQSVHQKGSQVILGARSALFLPYKNLGCIIVDEEHDTTYKQEQSVLYHARDMAVLRASIEQIPILLVSATPSLESMHNALSEKYSFVRLKERFKSTMPSVELIYHTERKDIFAPPLKIKLLETFKAKEQSLLFLNRRGYAPFVYCTHCSHQMRCAQCDTGLILHQKEHILKCHMCNYEQQASWCRFCGEEDNLIFQGLGVEKVKEALEALLPEARVHIMSSDHTATLKELQKLIVALESKEVDILVGTQMIAKGHHFPYLTCVGVLEAEQLLSSTDFRAKEHFFQLLTQVSGRAGRGTEKGQVYLQSALKDHRFLEEVVKGDYESWARGEIEKRQAFRWPPGSRLFSLIISGRKVEEVSAYALKLKKHMPSSAAVQCLGPVQAPMRYLKGQHRWRFLIKASSVYERQSFLKQFLKEVSPFPNSLKVTIDIDPYSFFMINLFSTLFA